MRRYTEEEKAILLKEVELLGRVSLVARKHNIPHTTIQNWIKRGLRSKKANYSLENRRLKKKLLEKELEISILKDLLKKTHQIL